MRRIPQAFSKPRLAQGGRALLHYIVERNVSDLPMLRLLLNPPAGAIRPELDALNRLKETPLAAAFAWGNIPASRELLAAGANLLPAGTARAPLKMLAGFLSSGRAPTPLRHLLHALPDEFGPRCAASRRMRSGTRRARCWRSSCHLPCQWSRRTRRAPRISSRRVPFN